MTAPASKRVFTGERTYVDVPVAVRPSFVSTTAWAELSAINDHIIDRVTYDHKRAQDNEPGLRAPHETLALGRGVCRDYAALFEHLARSRGYDVISHRSDHLDHAWNAVRLSGAWLIVDVTWNDGEIFSDGRPIPQVLRGDADYRRRYLLTTVEREHELKRHGLLRSTHHASDVEPVDYARTIEATAIVDRISPLVERKNALTRPFNDLVRRHKDVVDDYNRLVRDFNAKRTAAEQAPLRPMLDDLKARIEKVQAAITHAKTDIDGVDRQIDDLYRTFRQLDAQHPLGIHYRLTTDE